MVVWSQREGQPAEFRGILCSLILEEVLLEWKGKIFHVVMNHHQLFVALEVKKGIAHLLLTQIPLLNLLSRNYGDFVQAGKWGALHTLVVIGDLLFLRLTHTKHALIFLTLGVPLPFPYDWWRICAHLDTWRHFCELNRGIDLVVNQISWRMVLRCFSLRLAFFRSNKADHGRP